ncbi:MAG TPA: hypothetical protein VFV35_02690 [Acidimicrobiales bacterium]|nr:hypothetical protein [Acidimicrobiales bacterium]
MKRALAATVLVVALVAGACGDGQESADSADELPLLPATARGVGGGAGEAADAKASTMLAEDGASADCASESGECVDTMPYQPVEYRLAADVPALDGTAAAFRLTAEVDAADVTQVADAVGAEGEPVREDTGAWTAGVPAAGKMVLRVEADGSWFASRNDTVSDVVRDREVAACAAGERCADSEGAAAPPPEPEPVDLPSEADAESAARTLLEAAGTDLAGATVSSESAGRAVFVQFALRVEGRRVDGMGAAVSLGEAGAVLAANGTLADPAPLGQYPLAGTKAAFDRATMAVEAQAGPEVSVAVGAVEDRGASEPPPAMEPAPAPAPAPAETLPPRIVELTGAEVVYVVEYGRCAGDPVYLVPAYRFTSDDPDELGFGPVPAVTDEHLAANGAVGGDAPEPEEPSSSTEPAYEPCPGEHSTEPAPGAEPDDGGAGSSGSAGAGVSVEPAPAPDAPVSVPTTSPPGG